MATKEGTDAPHHWNFHRLRRGRRGLRPWTASPDRPDPAGRPCRRAGPADLGSDQPAVVGRRARAPSPLADPSFRSDGSHPVEAGPGFSSITGRVSRFRGPPAFAATPHASFGIERTLASP